MAAQAARAAMAAWAVQGRSLVWMELAATVDPAAPVAKVTAAQQVPGRMEQAAATAALAALVVWALARPPLVSGATAAMAAWAAMAALAYRAQRALQA
jgi:hypothetical protein